MKLHPDLAAMFASRVIQTEDERELIIALSGMCEQYLISRDDDGALSLDHGFLSAGEHAIELLFKHGLVDLPYSGAKWTDAGKQLNSFK